MQRVVDSASVSAVLSVILKDQNLAQESGRCMTDSLLDRWLPPVLLFLPVAGFWLIEWRLRVKRFKALAAVAAHLHLGFMERELFDFPENLLDFIKNWRKPHNAFGGFVEKDFLLVFDLNESSSWQKTRRVRTIVARRYDRPIPKFDKRLPNVLMMKQSGNWRIITTRTPGRLDAVEIEPLWHLLA